MRKVIAAFNMTLDGYCDHTTGNPDGAMHDHYTELINNSGVLLYGRTTYLLMEDHWPNLVKNPSGEKAMDEFAVAIDAVPKIVFSRTLKTLNWESASLATRSPEEEVIALRQQKGKDILVGSRSLIIELINKNLVDEFQLCIQPIVGVKGLSLFDKISDRIDMELIRTKSFPGMKTVCLYLNPKNNRK
jgi:dihydrofolate reductase